MTAAVRERLFFGRDICTIDPRVPAAEAVAVAGERIVAVGDIETCRSVLGADHEAVDLGGAALLPGFIDTHMHPMMTVYFDMNVDLRGTRSLGELQQRIGAMAGTVPPGQWIVGLQFEEQDLAEPRLPTRHDIDAAYAERPVLVVKHDGHTVIGNSAAIAAAGIPATVADPPGGVIDREQDGRPAGIFREAAARLLLDAVPTPEFGDFTRVAASSFAKLGAFGITGLGCIVQTGDEGPGGAAAALELTVLQLLDDVIPQSVHTLLIADDAQTVLAARGSALHDDSASSRRRIDGVKIFADGTFGSCTASMCEPFADHPETRGMLVHDEAELYRRMRAAHLAGLQIAVHAIGDAANAKCVELYGRLLREHPRPDHRHRIEHASQLDARTIAEMARLGIVVSTQPLFIHSEKHYLERRLGRERLRWTYPYRALLDAGVRVAGASDHPVESAEVLHAIQCCVTREGFEVGQCISAAEAIRMYTLDAAYSQFTEQVTGSISAGKRADLVVLSENPLRVDPEHIGAIEVRETISAGRTIFRR